MSFLEPDKEITESIRPGTYFLVIFVGLVVLFNAIFHHKADEYTSGYGVAFIMLVAAVANIIFLVWGLVKVARLKHEFPEYKYGWYWLIAFSPLLIGGFALWLMGNMNTNGC